MKYDSQNVMYFTLFVCFSFNLPSRVNWSGSLETHFTCSQSPCISLLYPHGNEIKGKCKTLFFFKIPPTPPLSGERLEEVLGIFLIRRVVLDPVILHSCDELKRIPQQFKFQGMFYKTLGYF